MKAKSGLAIRLISIIVMVILVFSVFALALQIEKGLSAPIVVMQDLTASAGQNVWSGRPIHAEYVSPSSILIGQQIDTIELRLKKSGSPVGLAEIGVFNTDLSVKRLFATKDVATLTTSYTAYTFAVPASQQPYTIQAGDRIGVKYTGGTNSVNISVMRDTDPDDPFDGANSYHTYYSGGWSTFPSNDLTMTLMLASAPSDNSSPSASVSHSPGSPSSSQTVTFTASATAADIELSAIQIFVNGVSIGSCTVSGTSADCVKTGGPYAEGSGNTYSATATDMLGQIGTSSTSTFSVTPSSGTGTFVDSEFEDGLDGPTSMTFAPDGRLFVAEKSGDLRVIKNGVLQSAPFLSVPVDTEGERGLLGVAIDPNFQTNKYVYIQYTTNTDPIHNRVSRFTASTGNPDVATAGSETIIIDLDNLNGAYHNAGAIHFGTDGKLYIAAGENGRSSEAQSLTSRLGKILRINADGTIPSDNPFFNTANAKKEIWAQGLRNPFTFGFKPGTSTMYINDVGQDAWEEINNGSGGANFGWPTCEGACSNSAFTNPVYSYPHPTGSGRSIAGGAFYEATQFPAEYRGSYFFGDYVADFIKRVTPTNQAVDFLTNTQTPVDIDIGPDGSLYYLSYQGGSVHKVQYVTTGGNTFPTAVASANPTAGASPLTVNFDGSASTDPDGDSLSYSWNFGDNTQSESGAAVAHIYSSPGSYSATLIVNDGNGGTDADVVSIIVGTPPVGSISNPPIGTKYDAGDTIAFSGSGDDAEDGTLPENAFNWKILLHHNTHTHPFQEFNGVKTGSFTLPQLSETDHDVWYRVYLTVTDSTGLQHQTTRDILPNKVTMTLASNIPELAVNLDGVPTITPSPVVGVVGITRTLESPLSQSLNGQTYRFELWSDGGAATHAIITPDLDTTYTAYYVPGTAEPETVMEDTTDDTGRSIFSGRPVYAEFVGPSSVLVGKQIDSITVSLKKSSGATGPLAEIGIINTDLSMKKVFATLDISTLTTSYTPAEYALPADDSYTIQAGDRIGVKYTGGTISSNYIAIMRDLTSSNPFDGSAAFLTFYDDSWTSQTSYDLTMTLKYGGGSSGTDTTPPTVTATPAGGTYTSSQSVELSSDEPATIRYTTDGNDPIVYSPEYTGPISITADTTLKFYGTDTYGNVGSILTEIYDIEVPEQPPGIIMEDTTANTGQNIWSGRPAHVEYVGTSSVLVGKQINSITVSFKKSNSPTGNAEIGIINSDLSMKKVFATVSVSTLTTSYIPYEFVLSGQPYTIQAGDRIGVKYASGTSTTNISVMRDTDPDDPFDGVNTYHSYYMSQWYNFPSNDLTMTLKLFT